MPRRIVLLTAGLALAWGGPDSAPGARAQDLPVAAAVAKTQSIKLDALETASRADWFDTVVGALAFDAKGDITEPRFEFYVWRGGKYEAMP